MVLKRLVLVFAAMALMAAVTVPASASTFGLANGLNYPIAFGEYVGPYNATLDGKALPAICVDINRTSYPGTTWNAVASLPLTAIDKQVAYLSKILFSIAPDTTGTVQMAIWYLMEGQVFGNHNTSMAKMGGTMVASVQAWLNAAVGAENDPSKYAGITLYSPTNTSNQRFMVLTPEPTTLVLYGLGLGVLLLGTKLWRRG